MSSDSWSDRLLGGLRKTQERLADNLAGLTGGTRLTGEQLDDIEDALIASDRSLGAQLRWGPEDNKIHLQCRGGAFHSD